MSFINFFKNVIRTRKKEKKQILRNFICLFLILVFLLNFLFIIDNNSRIYCSDNEDYALKKEIDSKNLDSLKLSQSLKDLFSNPFTNFSELQIFFNTYFKSNLNYDVELYVSESKSDGIITDNTINSGDNLLLNKSLMKEVYDEETTFEAYLDLKKESSPLWYQGNVSDFKYGFIKSINGTTGEIIDDTRYLVDNLMPIFLLIENIGDKIDDPFNGEYPKDSIIEMFNLINSSEFWDSDYNGFFESNKSTGGEKYIKSNLYAVLANLLIHHYRDVIGITISDNAYDLANNTMRTLIDNAWNNAWTGFYNSTDSDWDSTPGKQQYVYLDVNALGIIALLEYWLMTGNSEYKDNATALYNKLSEDAIDSGQGGGLWNDTYGAYEYYRHYDWDPITDRESKKLDLEANALMMQACLKLFEVTGNFSYYQRALKIHDFIEKNLYNNSINAYMTSIDTKAPFINNTNVNFHKNLKLCEAYLKAFEIYNSTVLDASYNISGKVDYIMNQDSINLTCTYAFEKDYSYFNGGSYDINTTRYDNITGASVTYKFTYPNGTEIEKIHDTTINSTTNLIYPINNSLPFGTGYTIYIYANCTYFATTVTIKTFNVISGLRDFSASGLEDPLYQGEKTNITIQIYSDYNYNLTLNVTMFGDGIETLTRENITFINNNQSSVAFNITVNNDATPGNVNITFTFKNRTVLYLERKVEIEIKNALSYSDLIYSSNVVPGDFVQISLDLINFLTNDTQDFNLSFSGTYIHDQLNIPITLKKNERKSVSYFVYTELIIKTNTIEIKMRISKGKTVYFNNEFQKEEPDTEKLTVEIVPSFEIINIEFPEKVTQGTYAYLVIFIQNNKEQSEDFSLFINDEEVETERDALIPGENRIEYKILPAWNPYEFGIKSYHIEIEDDSDNVIVEDYIEYEIELSAFYLIFFYVIPIVVPIGVILYYKSKDIKHKLLRR